MPELHGGDARGECGTHECRGGGEENIVNNCLGKVLEKRVEDVPRMRVFFLQIAATSHHMGNHMPFKQWNIAFEVEYQNWPRIGEGEVGEGEVVLRVETGQLRRSGSCILEVSG